MTRRGLWVARVAFTLIYIAVTVGWQWWLNVVAPHASVWQRAGLLLASGLVWLIAAAFHAVWRAKTNPNARTGVQWQVQRERES